MTMSTYTLEANGSRGRQVKFTPERMDQIRNLVERGTCREAIAEIIGCTVGSLQVTCSKAGISLRRPRTDPMLLRTQANGNNGRPTMALPRRPAELPVATGQAKATLLLRLEMGERTREVAVPIPAAMLGDLSIAAEFRDMRLGDLLLATLTAYVQSMMQEPPVPALPKDGPEK